MVRPISMTVALVMAAEAAQAQTKINILRWRPKESDTAVP